MSDETGAELIAAERLRQIQDEGYSRSHDASHNDGALRDAARGYLFAAEHHAVDGPMKSPYRWPWGARHWKPSHGRDPVRDLVKAGALIAAEIDRLQAAR